MNNYPKDLKAKGDYVLFDPLPEYEAPKDILILNEAELMKQAVFKPEGKIVSVGSKAEKEGYKAEQKIYFEENRQRRFWLSGKLYGIVKWEFIQLILPEDYQLQYGGDMPVMKDTAIITPNGESKIHLVN